MNNSDSLNFVLIVFFIKIVLLCLYDFVELFCSKEVNFLIDFGCDCRFNNYLD